MSDKDQTEVLVDVLTELRTLNARVGELAAAITGLKDAVEKSPASVAEQEPPPRREMDGQGESLHSVRGG